MSQESPDITRTRLNLETAQIAWRDLQVFFAKGVVIAIDSHDLIEVATWFIQDQVTKIEAAMAKREILKISDAQAKTWFAQDIKVWAVVVKPWVLVQAKPNTTDDAPFNHDK